MGHDSLSHLLVYCILWTVVNFAPKVGLELHLAFSHKEIWELYFT